MHEDPEEYVASSQNTLPDLVPIIAVGASAGGLLALQQFFRPCSVESGAAFVVVQHLSPTHESLMEELLTKESTMPVKMLTKNLIVEPDHIYLIPPAFVMRLKQNELVLLPRHPGMFQPIDLFFESLAAERKDAAVAVILSGTGSDGTNGAEAVSAANGFVLVQDPSDATFDGMPASVLRNGIPDAILPASKLAQKALECAGCFPVQPVTASIGQGQNIAPKAPIDVLFQILKKTSRIDFSHYKNKTIDRRLERRIHENRLGNLAEYLDLLVVRHAEADILIQDLLIGVTSFFRDVDVFETMSATVIPSIVEGLDQREEARIWVSGCSTGQEAYSIAMLLHEEFTKRGQEPRFRIFATDVNPASVARAAEGIFTPQEVKDVSSEKIEKFFFKSAENFKVGTDLRGRMVFARHDLLSDPPFTRLKLVCSRNTLIYFKEAAQRHALNMLRMSVQKGGYVLLGRSETLYGERYEFETVVDGQNIFRRLGPYPNMNEHSLVEQRAAQDYVEFRAPSKVVMSGRSSTKIRNLQPHSEVKEFTRVNEVLLQHWCPPSLQVDLSGHVIQFQGDISRFLQTRSGLATLTIQSILPEALHVICERLMEEVISENAVRVSEPIDFPSEDMIHRLRICALPVSDNGIVQSLHFCFEPIGENTPAPQTVVSIDVKSLAHARTQRLERALLETRANLQDAIEELETSNEELQSTNEELMASNEELHASNEELQSVNEELVTINAEYREKVIHMNGIDFEMNTVMTSAKIATLFLDEAQLVRRFSTGACNYFKLRDSDIGRPLAELSHSLTYDRLQDDLIEAMLRKKTFRCEVETSNDELLQMEIIPYLMQAGKPPWALVTFTDIGSSDALQKMRKVIDALPANIAVLASDATIILTNDNWDRFGKANGASNEKGMGIGANYLNSCLPLDERSADAMDALKALNGIRSVLQGKEKQFSMIYPCHSPTQQRWFSMTVLPVAGKATWVVVSHTDITELREELRTLQ